jgi:hypothetical protein
MLKEMPKNEGSRGKIQEHLTGSNIVQPPDNTPTLAEIGIEKHESSRYQKIASLPEELFKAKAKENQLSGLKRGNSPVPQKSAKRKKIETRKELASLHF